MIDRRILVIDDDHHHRNQLALALRDRGCDVIGTSSGRLAIDIAAQQQPHVVIAELVLPDVRGIQLARAIRCVVDHDVMMIALTRASAALHARARARGRL